jgi:biopolymer transport protein ExbD
MAVSVSSNASPAKQTPTALSEINVTPFVDVMLVLLVIFMVTAPLMQQGIQVDLPKTEAGKLDEAPTQVDLVIDRNQSIYLDGERVAASALRSQLETLAGARPNVVLHVQADASLPYGLVAQILAEVRRSKIAKVALVTEADEERVRR